LSLPSYSSRKEEMLVIDNARQNHQEKRKSLEFHSEASFSPEADDRSYCFSFQLYSSAVASGGSTSIG